MKIIMRTTVSLDDRLGEAAKAAAAREGLSLSAYVARVLRDALSKAEPEPPRKPFRLVTAGDHEPLTDKNLDRTSEFLTDDDAFRYRG